MLVVLEMAEEGDLRLVSCAYGRDLLDLPDTPSYSCLLQILRWPTEAISCKTLQLFSVETWSYCDVTCFQPYTA